MLESVKRFVYPAQRLEHKPTWEVDHQLVENVGPIGDGHRPSLGDIPMSQVEDLSNGLSSRKDDFVLGDLAQLAIIGLDGVVGVDQPSDFVREVEEA